MNNNTGKTIKNDEKAIRELVNTWFKASKEGDVETVLSLMTDDVIFMTSGQEPFGKEEFEKMSKEQQGLKMDGRIDLQEIKIMGNWSYIRNYIEVEMYSPKKSEPTKRSGYTLTILHKEPDGKWKLARDANLLTIKE